MRRSWAAALAAMVLGTGTMLLLAPAAGAAQVTTPYPDVSVQPGSSVKLDLSVVGTPEPVGLAVKPPDGWTATLRGGGFVVSGVTAGSTEKPGAVTLEVAVPVDAAPGAYPVTVTATGADGATSLPLTLDVKPQVDQSLGLKADFPELKGSPSDTFDFNLTITNNTPEQQVFTFDPQGPQGWDVTASPQAEQRAQTVSVDGGATSQVKVSAKPPVGIAGGSYPIDVKVTTASGLSGSLKLTAIVSGQGSMQLGTPDQRLNFSVNSGSTSKQTLVIANDGTAALENVQMTATPPSDWTVDFEPKSVASVAPGQSATVVMTVKPAKDAVAGDYSISVNAAAGTISKSTEMRATVKTSRWWGFVGVGVIVVAVGALGIVFRRFGRR